jgi:glycosyltransferase involved in cell wall biosynthesis
MTASVAVEVLTTRTRVPWVLVGGGFHTRGGQDKANAALADYLLRRGHPVHLVGHDIDPDFLDRPGATVHRITRPAGRHLLGWLPLRYYGSKVAAAVRATNPGARVVVNGGVCPWPDINWVHSVHHAWPVADDGAPLWFRAKNRLFKWWARRGEWHAIRKARLVVANSAQTRRHLIRHLGIDPDRVHVVYLGTDPAWSPPAAEERVQQRRRLGILDDRPVVLFVGALGYDNNKGFDTLLAAWRTLVAAGNWDAELLVAGSGNGLPRWQRAVARDGLAGTIRFLGFCPEVMGLLAGVDLLVSPARYEAYGLNVQEAVCRGVPALVSSRAGVVEQYPPDLAEMVLSNPDDAVELARRLLLWRSDRQQWRERFHPLSEALRVNSWDQMAARIVALAEAEARPEAPVSSLPEVNGAAVLPEPRGSGTA